MALLLEATQKRASKNLSGQLRLPFHDVSEKEAQMIVRWIDDWDFKDETIAWQVSLDQDVTPT